MDRPSIYLETSVVSYLAADPSRDPATLHRQRITAAWWAQRERFALHSSWVTVREAFRGERAQAARRVRLIATLPLLAETPATQPLTIALAVALSLPARARDDAAHVALAAVYGLDYLVTWDQKHITSPRARAVIDRICRSRGLNPPLPCSPELLIRLR